MNKAQFLAKPRIRNLPRAEQDRRWRQHDDSERGLRRTASGLTTSGRAQSARSGRARPRAALASSNPAERECARHYGETLLNPFDSPAGACVPVLPCLDTAKRKIFCRGTGYVQSNGFGGLTCYTSLAGDTPAAIYTTGTGSSNTMTWDAAHMNKISPNSELTAADFSAQQVQARIVGLGIRLRYTGKQVDMNGSVYALEEPNHGKTDTMNVEDLRAFDRVKTQPFTREWVVAAWQPVLPLETAFSNNAYASPFPTPTNPLIILIACQGSGTAGNPSLPFEWEYFAHYEAIGIQARGKSESHIAPVQAQRVMAAMQKAPTTVFDAASNHHVSAVALSNRVVDEGSDTWSSWGSNLAQGAIGFGTRVVATRAAQQYMAGGLAALAL
jgi:hypothetical protein